MRLIPSLLTALALGTLAVSATVLAEDAPKKKGLAAMSWLQGRWSGGDGTSTWETCYTSPSGGMMLSATKEIKGGRAVMFDYELFVEREGKVSLTPFPFGKRSKTFPMTSQDVAAKKAVFENPAHDFPRKFTYQRTGDKLAITLEGEQGGNPLTIKLNLERRP